MISSSLEARPRSTGEILDDAWRMALADFAFLLGVSGLFLLPASAVLLFLLAQPAAPAIWTRILWPAATSLLLVLTGLGAGACQEAFHCWGEGHQPTLKECLAAAISRGLNHLTAQAIVLVLPLVALFCNVSITTWPELARSLAVAFCVLVSFPVWTLTVAWHTGLAAGQNNLWKVWRLSSRAGGRQPLKVLLLVTTRLMLLAFAILNLHLFGHFALWAAESLGGFEVAVLHLWLSLSNPIYLLALGTLAWWLLTPAIQAANYLFYIDARTRHEGLDLWFRVDEQFPIRQALPLPPAKSAQTASLVVSAVLAVVVCGLLVQPARAGSRLNVVKEARQEVRAIVREIDKANPYPGGRDWLDRLNAIGERLEQSSGSTNKRFLWFAKTLDGFAELAQKQALDVLDRIDGRLALIEESFRPPPGTGKSRDELRALIPPDPRSSTEKKPKSIKKDDSPKKDEKKVRRVDELGEFGPGRRGGPGVVGPVGLGGSANVLMFLCIGVLVVVIVLAAALVMRQWLQNRAKPVPRQAGIAAPAPDDYLDQPDQQDVQSLWRQADELARAGNFLAAVRTLYVSVLALLHQAGLIRYERTRTNGEYADQLRPRSTLHAPFLRLTGMFELKWYGERACHPDDYHSCRGLAEEIRGGVTA